ncbi:MAG TPA: TonB-dependent receptor [Bryobacteraceae bacterium]|nr:TonB-dependent receptor [Bryobacteraceae bacterium]
MDLSRGFAVLLSIAAASCAFSQVDTGTITGTITDSSGAAVPNVKVTIIQASTNFESRAVTNAEGLFRVQSLLPGSYNVTFEAAGFKRYIQQGVELRVGDVLPLNVKLEVGQVNESVQVSAQGTLLETETSSTGSLTEGDTLYKMPLYQRYVLNALNLNPGMTQNGYSYGGSLGGFNVAGQRSTGTAVFEDGVLGNDPQSSTGNDIKSVENSVDEVKVLTGTLPAEYGHSTGGIVTVVKKGGTNSLHGMAADLGRTRSMTHRQFFNLYRTSDPQPGAPNGVPAWFMQPDASVSGPVVLPHIYNGRNKTFFFFGYQKLIEKKASAYTSQTPTPALLSGDFTFGGLGVPLYDPLTTRQNPDGTWTRDPLPGNIVPQSRFDPVAAKIIGMNPWLPPNTPGSLTSSGPVSNFTYNAKSRTFFEDYSQRIDQQFSSSFKLYGSYTYNHQSGLGRPTSVAIPVFDGANGTLTPYTQRNLSVGATKLFGATGLNDIRLGYFRARNDTIVPSYNQGWAATLGIPNDSPLLMPSFSSTAASGYTSAPALNTMYGLTVPGPSRTVRETLSLRDDFSKMISTHALKMGYELLYFRANYFQLGQPSGVFQFDNMTAGLQPTGNPVPNTGNLFAGFELGAVAAASFNIYTTTWLPRDAVNSLYFQDDWKVSRTVTLNLGLRWSTESPFHTAHGQESNFSPTTVDPITGRMGAIVHPTGGLNERSLRDFQPRIGVAWHPLDRWVFRGGFGINTIDIRFPNALQQFDEFQAIAVQQRAPGDPRPLFQLSQGPATVVYPVQSNLTAPYVGTNFGSRSLYWMDGHLHPGYVANWNITSEYQFSNNNVLKLTYQGSAGIHLIESWNINVFPTDFGASNPALQAAAFAAPQNYLPYPQFGAIRYMSNTGHNSYHAGTVQFQKRYSQGVVLNTFYTFSKALDDCDSDSGTCSGVAPVADRNLNKGRAGYDRNHVIVANATYELPIGKGRRFVNHNRVLDYLIGGYELAWIQTFETGNPFGFSFANSPYNYFPSSIGNYVPNLVCNNISEPHFELGSLIGGNRFNQALENPVLNVNCFAPPAPFTPGNAGRNIVTGPGLVYSQASAKKNFAFKERWNLQLRFDFQNPFHNWGFNNPTNSVDFKNPQLFGKITSDQTTASFGGEPLMNLMLRLSW